ncbi:hypothetical protein NDU88_011478 [Pleurodeles waltl]|uniref:Uncharacterized protein n=1 Tax=Pleurodeles waltl TaxID=8319 RepID=A0AAV7KNB6_PLEWA|nr:hypothetical protein NDU88_000175 [Pleurodeles waltl]KAJ1079612.1 hypothetical protein NDU88_000150 [Pleurodeles waltl]KAJ1133181.1 hypothetical protein NDU88_011478 [Pleurodeles waltl]
MIVESSSEMQMEEDVLEMYEAAPPTVVLQLALGNICINLAVHLANLALEELEPGPCLVVAEEKDVIGIALDNGD